MIKNVTIGNRQIPIPVPLHTMSEVLAWLEETFLRNGAIVTAMSLNQEALGVDFKSSPLMTKELSAIDDVRVVIENPRDLSLQTVEVLGDMAYALALRMRQLTVELWGVAQPDDSQRYRIREVFDDIKMTLELIDHLNGIVEYSQVLMAGVNSQYQLVKGYLLRAKSAQKNDMKELIKIFSTRIEPSLRLMSSECESLQLSMLTGGAVEFQLQVGEA
jgi:hypothetical protein